MMLGVLLGWCTVAGAADEVWEFVDGEGVLHLGNTGNRSPTPPPASDDAPAFVAERGLTWIGHTWRLRWPDATSALGAPSARAGLGAAPVRWPRGLEAMRPYLEAAARAHAVEPALVIAVAAAESAFNVDAVSPKGALGLMQIMPATAARYGVDSAAGPGVRRSVMEPAVNASVGSRYLADLLRLFGGDRLLALAAYNAGEGAVSRYGNRVPPYPETQQYVEKVMQFYRALTE